MTAPTMRSLPTRGAIVELMGRRVKPLAIAASMLALGGALSMDTAAAAAPDRPMGFKIATLFPRFSPAIHDYAVRCHGGRAVVRLHARGKWRVAVGTDRLRSGDRRRVVAMGAGDAFVVTTERNKYSRLRRYHVRCLPSDFPAYRFARRPGRADPKYFSVDASFFIPYGKRYSIIFDNHGVPVWWFHTTARDSRVLPDGNILWFQRSANRWEVRRLDGTLVRALPAIGRTADPHDVQILANGDYLLGAEVTKSHVDTSRYGGSRNGDVLTTELQEVTPSGKLAWDWSSQGHISLSETGRWWPHVIRHDEHGYDTQHWNSIEPDGGAVIASFRNLDAVYKINKQTGQIAWKLGGTRTPRSLEVKGDPRRQTFGGQHDARLLPDGTLTAFDDRTELANEKPRAVRYRINERARTATLLSSITEREVPVSTCCGSARRLQNGSWLIDWGRNPTREGPSNAVGGYTPNGTRTFLLSFGSTASYRAEPVPKRALSARALRRGMRAMCRSGCG
jgi:hypothetical protein